MTKVVFRGVLIYRRLNGRDAFYMEKLALNRRTRINSEDFSDRGAESHSSLGYLSPDECGMFLRRPGRAYSHPSP